LVTDGSGHPYSLVQYEYDVALPGPERASALRGQDSANEEIVRKWYDARENKDLDTFNAMLANNFTFSRAAATTTSKSPERVSRSTSAWSQVLI
jgi:hypothetical protein